MLTSIGLTLVEKALNGYLHLDPQTQKKLGHLNGKVVAIQMEKLDYDFFLIFTEDSIQLSDQYTGGIDTVIRGTPSTLLKMGLSRDKDKVVTPGTLRIEGDLDLGQKVKQMFDHIDIDWEEHFSHYVGDTIAHTMGNWTRSLCDWSKKTKEQMQKSLGMYLQEEKRQLPTHLEVQDFLADVDTLRSDVDRMAARIKRLAERE